MELSGTLFFSYWYFDCILTFISYFGQIWCIHKYLHFSSFYYGSSLFLVCVNVKWVCLFVMPERLNHSTDFDEFWRYKKLDPGDGFYWLKGEEGE